MLSQNTLQKCLGTSCTDPDWSHSGAKQAKTCRGVQVALGCVSPSCSPEEGLKVKAIQALKTAMSAEIFLCLHELLLCPDSPPSSRDTSTAHREVEGTGRWTLWETPHSRHYSCSKDLLLLLNLLNNQGSRGFYQTKEDFYISRRTLRYMCP